MANLNGRAVTDIHEIENLLATVTNMRQHSETNHFQGGDDIGNPADMMNALLGHELCTIWWDANPVDRAYTISIASQDTFYRFSGNHRWA